MDRYMTGMDTLWDTYITIINRVLSSIACIGHQMVHGDIMVYKNIQGSSLAHNSGQWSFGAFPLERPPNRGLEHTFDLRLPRIEEWMGEPWRITYTSIVELWCRCQQMRIGEMVTHKSVPRYHEGILFMPLGLTNTLVTIQYCK
jgi:hypothetical protein